MASNVKVLLVDDNPMVLGMLKQSLSPLGEVATATDAADALLRAVDDPPDLLVTDYRMPGMDGHEVAQCVRQDPQLRDVVLIALTGWGQEEDRRRSRAAGFDDHLVKPVDVSALQALLVSLPEQRRSDVTP